MRTCISSESNRVFFTLDLGTDHNTLHLFLTILPNSKQMIPMPIPNPSGGEINVERETASKYNKNKVSRAKYANMPDEQGWEHSGEQFKGECARQCAAENFFYRYCSDCDTRYHFSANSICPECNSEEYYLKRCTFCAEPEKMTCKSHGGTHKLTAENRDKLIRGSTTSGAGFAEIMLCPCSMHKDDCPFAGQLVNSERYGSTVPRCLPEQELYDAIVYQFKTEYELDDVADMMMLSRLAMSQVRLNRGEKIIAKYGENVERTRNSPDGSWESWYEQSPSIKTVDNLDRRMQAWLKELQVSRAARIGKKINANVKADITSILSMPDTQVAEYYDIIDVD